MPTIIGNVRPEDDYTHTLGPEPNFNESVYFNFFDRAQQRGGFVRIGNRANEGYAEMTVIVYEPDGSALFNYKRPAITSNDGWNAGGLRVDVEQPGGVGIRTAYAGSAVHLRNPRAMADPRAAFRDNPHRRLTLDLLHEGVGPMYGRVGDAASKDQFARAHYEQHMRVLGTVQVDDGTPVAITGHGLRDHSWGPRFWQSTPSYRWITGNFGDDRGMVILVSKGRTGGVFYHGDAFFQITAVELETTYEADTAFHQGLCAQLTLSDGSQHRVEGTVKGFIPLRNRRNGVTTTIGEGMTEYVLDGEHVGYGLSEYLDQPEA